MNRNTDDLRPKIAAALLFVFCLTSTTVAQSTDEELWIWTQDAKHLRSVVQISSNGGVGTGVLARVYRDQVDEALSPGYVLTAYHILEPSESDAELSDEDSTESIGGTVSKSSSVRVLFRDGTESDGQLIEFDRQHDLALVQTQVPDGIEPATIANITARHRMYLEFAGLGGGASLEDSLRHFSGRANRPTNANFIYADETLLPGDSGGPIFNKRKELVGIISGGWFWWNAKKPDGTAVLSTWPARASNLNPIRKLLAFEKEDAIAGPTERLAEK